MVCCNSPISKQLDRKFKYLLGDESLTMQFRGVFDAGGADYWYSRQQKFFPSLLLSPSPSPEIKRDPIAVVSHPLRWRALSEESGAVTILPENSKHIEYPRNGAALTLPYLEVNDRYLSVPQRKFNLNPRDVFNDPTVVTDFKKLNLGKFITVQKIDTFCKWAFFRMSSN